MPESIEKSELKGSKGVASPRSLRRWLALCAALLAVLAIALGAAFWKDFAARYHLWRLYTKHGYFDRIHRRPEGTPEKMAIKEYLQNPNIQRELLPDFMLYFGLHEGDLAPTELGALGCDARDLWVAGKVPHTFSSCRPGNQVHHFCILGDLLTSLAGKEFWMGDYRDRRFTVLQAREAFRDFGLSRDFEVPPPDAGPVLLIRGKGPDLVEHFAGRLHDPDPHVRLVAARELLLIGPDAGGESEIVREETCGTLGSAGIEWKLALTCLAQVAADKDEKESIRQAAELAIQRIEADKNAREHE